MPRVKTFSRGGIAVDSNRSLTADQAIRPLFLPSLALLPLFQYAGAQAEWTIEAGQLVAEDQVLARGANPDDLPLHSPIPGRVVEFREVTLPGGATSSAALIQLEGTFGRTGRPVAKATWALVDDDELRTRIRSAGLFLQSSPLDPRCSLEGYAPGIDALVINALQPEPYLSLSSHLLRERGDDLLEGTRILQKLFKPAQTHLVFDPEQPEAWVREASQTWEGVELHVLEFRYPQAQQGILLKTIGVPFSPSRPDRALVLDTASVLAIRDAVVEGRPQVEKTVVVSGRGIRHPGVYRVRIGTPLVQLLKDAGGVTEGEHKVLIGGPFQGHEAEHLSTPILKSTQAVLVLDRHEVNASGEQPCIRCGQCVLSCPVGLEPLNLHKALQQGKLDLARSEGLDLCIECGICSYVCPSRVPLVSDFQKAKEHPRGA